MKHKNQNYDGSFGKSLASKFCIRCDLPFVWQITQDRIGWIGLPCRKTPYTPKEQFDINTEWIATVKQPYRNK